MTSEQEYWRDRIVDLLRWGTSVFFIVVVWSITEHNKFELFEDSKTLTSFNEGYLPYGNSDKGAIVRAVALVIFCVFFGYIWFKSVAWVYDKKFNKDQNYDTLIPRKFALAYCLILAISLVILALGMGMF